MPVLSFIPVPSVINFCVHKAKIVVFFVLMAVFPVRRCSSLMTKRDAAWDGKLSIPKVDRNRYNKSMKRFYFVPLAVSVMFIVACNMTTPYHVTTVIGKGEIKEATVMFAELLNEGEIEDGELERLLRVFTTSQKYSLDNADDLFGHLKAKSKTRILPWYVNEYLQKSEEALGKYKFEQAREIWKRYQKIRREYYPKLTESTPVLGIIDLREAEFLARNQKYARARARFNGARKQLTRKTDFDLVQQTAFKRLVEDVKKMLLSEKSQKPKRK